MTDKPAADDMVAPEAVKPEGEAAAAAEPQLVPAEQVTAQADATLKTLIEGIELTERELHKVLSKNGVKKFSPEGEKFDPNLHEAMYEMPTQDLPSGHVAQVMQAGYMLGDRVLRPAMVGVSKGPVKTAPASASVSDNN